MANAWMGLLDERGKIGPATSPIASNVEPSASSATTLPWCTDSTKPERMTWATTGASYRGTRCSVTGELAAYSRLGAYAPSTARPVSRDRHRPRIFAQFKPVCSVQAGSPAEFAASERSELSKVGGAEVSRRPWGLSLIHISEPTR